MTEVDKPLILAIDDQQLNLELLKFIIEQNEYGFEGTDDPDIFFEILEKKLPDLILLDIVMPKIEGFELCLKIKSIPKYEHIPVIFLTGKVNVKYKIRGFEVGGVDYVTKPFNKQELTARIKTHLELVRAKNKVKKQADDLRQSNILKDRMFSIIGHDLRSPLSAIKLKLDFILRGIIDPKEDAFLEDTIYNMLDTTNIAFNLLENLLGWARSESGVLQVFPEKININEIVEQTLRLLKLSADHKKITMENNVPIQVNAMADMNMIKTVLRNLLSNALKFTPTNGAIKINTREEKEKIIIEITDNGKGIPKENIAAILNPNEHFSELGTEKEPGTGLGLILCQDFINKNGGVLKITSELEKGSTFYFDLPKNI